MQSWLPPGKDIPISKGYRGRSSSAEWWPDTQHLYFTHLAENAPGFASHTALVESTGPTGFLSSTPCWRCKDGRIWCFLEDFPPCYQSPQSTYTVTHCQENVYHRKLYLRVLCRVWMGVGLEGSFLFCWLEVVFCCCFGVGDGRFLCLFLFSFYFLSIIFWKKRTKIQVIENLNMSSGGKGGLTSLQTHAKKTYPKPKTQRSI